MDGWMDGWTEMPRLFTLVAAEKHMMCNLAAFCRILRLRPVRLD